jgi:eukaryotic-like serine/threonine-protein kinase
MTLAPGTKLGPYEIVALLGAGGMGEVYRGRDTRLDRTVAIKILPRHLSDNPEARERFDREARAISSLSHPNICHLYDVGAQDRTNYLVMEYLEGETLADRLGKGPLPLEQFFKIGIEICEGLEKAHRSGVVHRDLKPGNIMLTKNGAKLMDFGLAKAIPTAAPPTSSFTATLNPPAASHPLTVQGTVVGTFQYMSPEQLEGKKADARSDIFSLGAVLYEMLAGRRAFGGKSPLSVASAILENEPAPISTSKPMTPALDHAVRRCLAKDPEERWQAARDVGLELKWISGDGSQAGVPAAVAAGSRTREWLAWATAALLALLAIGFAIGFFVRATKTPQAVRLSAEIGADAKLYTESGNSTILSPDSTRLAFIAVGSDQKRRIYVRSLDQLHAKAFSGTENAENPFFSPDGQWLAFFADHRLKKISVQSGAAVTVCDAANGRGGSWSEDGSIVFAPDIRSALFRVSSAGGMPQPLIALDQQAGEATQRWPQVLPGGKAVLFTSNTHGGNYEDADITVYLTSSQQRKAVVHGGFFARYVPTGHVVYMHEGTLFAVPFDPKRLEVTGLPAPILEGVSAVPGDGSAQFSFSNGGNLMYVAGYSGFQTVSIYWMDREGKFTPLRETPGNYYSPAFSPDGKRLALQISDGKKNDIWVYDWEHDTLTRLTFSGGNLNPIWTPDGQRITYSSFEKNGVADLFWTRADGTGDTLRLTETKNRKLPASWRPDGKVLAFDQVNSGTSWSTLTLTIEGKERLGWKPENPKPFLSGPFTEQSSSFSPDGRWLAYESNETGEFEVYVRPFPGPGGRWQISTGGGRFPKWSRNGTELFYRTQDNKIMVAGYAVSDNSFRTDKPRLWSPGQFTERLGVLNFDLHPDGKRFAVLKAPAISETSPGNRVTFVFNFFDELRRKVQPQR